MKRELKVVFTDGSTGGATSYRKAHPDEKGTESALLVLGRYLPLSIARLIPMKRELKDGIGELNFTPDQSQGSSR